MVREGGKEGGRGKSKSTFRGKEGGREGKKEEIAKPHTWLSTQQHAQGSSLQARQNERAPGQIEKHRDSTVRVCIGCQSLLEPLPGDGARRST